MAATIEIVPGNIKQQLIPFALNPESGLFNAKNDGKSPPQHFSFRPAKKTNDKNFGRLNFCPKSYHTYFNEDISYKQIYSNATGTSSPTFDSLLGNIPAIVIREYIQDTALDQCINFFINLVKEVMALFGEDGIQINKKVEVERKPDIKNADGSTSPGETDKEYKARIKAEQQKSDNTMWDSLQNVMWYVIKYISGITKPNNIITPFTTGARDNSRYTSVYSTIDYSARIVDFPYQLYYQLQSCTTTGIFEIPCIKSDKILYSSKGNAGYETEGSGFRLLPKSVTDLPYIGSALGAMFGNIGISWTPWWNATKGNATPEPDVNITFSLFNDSETAAITNFIFVNTLIPNNKWIQYGLFQHAPHIYDIKLEGYNRLFACTGEFEVSYSGILRDPPDRWFETDGPLTKYINNSIDSKKFLDGCRTNKLIKIPDVYEIKMTFKSLLPSNFNQYLYTLVANNDMLTTYSDNNREESKLPSMLLDSFKGLFAGAKDAWNGKTDHMPK